jgi:hypothetical protein
MLGRLPDFFGRTKAGSRVHVGLHNREIRGPVILSAKMPPLRLPGRDCAAVLWLAFEHRPCRPLASATKITPNPQRRVRGVSAISIRKFATAIAVTPLHPQPLLASASTSPHKRGEENELICPTGTSAISLSSPCCKNILLRRLVETPLDSRRPALTRGAYRDRHGRWVRDAVDAAVSQDE